MKTQVPAPTVEDNIARAATLAIKLGASWTPQKHTSWYGFGVEERSTGKSLWLHFNSSKWHVTCGLPKDRKNESPYYDSKEFPQPSCYLSADKSIEQIVKDIERRIFPEYNTLFAEVKRRVNAHNDSYDRHDALKVRVEETLGQKFRPDCHNPGQTDNEMYFDCQQYKYDFKVKVESGKIKLECGFNNDELGLEIIKIIQEKIQQ